MKDENTNLYVPTKTFLMPKAFKRLVASFGANKDLRDHYRGMAIQAVLQSQDIPKSKKEKK